MVVEFVNAFKSFLGHKVMFASALLMQGVTRGCDHADIISQILLMFLQILLSNEDFKVPGLKIELADLPLTEYTVSFLVSQLMKSQMETKKRIRKEEEFARKEARKAEKVADLGVEEVMESSDEDGDGTVDAAWLISSSSDEEEYTETQKKSRKAKKEKRKQWNPQEAQEKKLTAIACKLMENDFWDLLTQEQLAVLTFMMGLILESEDLSEHYNELNDERTTASKLIEEARKNRLKPAQNLV